jgi:hypothetical protein
MSHVNASDVSPIDYLCYRVKKGCQLAGLSNELVSAASPHRGYSVFRKK